MQKTKNLLCVVMDVDQIYHCYVHFVFKPQPFFSKPGMVAHIYNSTTQEEEAGGSDLRPTLTI